MLLAFNDKGDYRYASPDETAFCPICKEVLIPKCGDINIWHWAHMISSDCCYNTEPESEWHLLWKQRALNAGFNIEHVIEPHIFDALDVSHKTLYEFQHSAISPSEIKDRSALAVNKGYLINWVFDLTYKQLNFTEIENNLYTLKNRWHKKSINALFQQNIPIYGKVFFDLRRDNFFYIKKMYDNGNGYGVFLNRDLFLKTGGGVYGI